MEKISLEGGVSVRADFPDPARCLDTVYRDLDRFLKEANIPVGGKFRIATSPMKTTVPETYRIEVSSEQCEIRAGDTEGIRRGVYFLEDELRRAGGPFLTLGRVERIPVIRDRISKCFWGPIHRPPFNRDELADDIDYYPEEYLDRLAHEAVNGLYICMHYHEICESSVIPERGNDPQRHRRLAKLRRVVEKCARYGIRIYIFTHEPRPMDVEDPIVLAHPEIVGHKWHGKHYFVPSRTDCYYRFCTSSAKGQAYLEETTRYLFEQTPGLGGVINYIGGETGTYCWYGFDGNQTLNCPRCASRKPIDVLLDTIRPQVRGMRAVRPDAQFFLYNSGQFCLVAGKVDPYFEPHAPEGVIPMYNFEDGGKVEQCGRTMKLRDYWLSYVGPGQGFVDSARMARKHGVTLCAKIQVSNSHEVATVPYIPVPGNLYEKYRAMHELGIGGAFYGWFFGTAPGPMTAAAGDLAFAPFPSNEDDFLLRLAAMDWGDDAATVVQAWKIFQRAFTSYFPKSRRFLWWGPMHDAPVWPLFLEPQDRPVPPSWCLIWPSDPERLPIPAGGERIGDIIAPSHTLAETMALCRNLFKAWNDGVLLMEGLLPRYADNTDRARDIGIAAALGLQFESAYNIFDFYRMREDLFRAEPEQQVSLLKHMEATVRRELEIDSKLLLLARADSRLGYHAEAEGHKYSPDKIEWRMARLEELLRRDFPMVEKKIQARELLFPAWTGKNPRGPTCRARQIAAASAGDTPVFDEGWLADKTELGIGILQTPERNVRDLSAAEFAAYRTVWQAGYDDEAIVIVVSCAEPRGERTAAAVPAPVRAQPDYVLVEIEPRRLWPCLRYMVARADGSRKVRSPVPFLDAHWSAATRETPEGWMAYLRIPFAAVREKADSRTPLRVNIRRVSATEQGVMTQNWLKPTHKAHAHDEPVANLGWLLFD